MKRLRAIATTFVLLSAFALGAVANGHADPLVELLALGGFERRDLGATSRGDWWGTTRGQGLSYRMPHVDEMRADPLRVPLWADGYRLACERLGGDAGLLLSAVGVQPRLTSFSLVPPTLPDETDLASALDLLRRPLDEPSPFGGSFGVSRRLVPSLGPASEHSRADAAALPVPLRAPVARLLVALAHADWWVRLAWRDVPPGVAASAGHQGGLTASIADGAEFSPAVADAARRIDAESLAYAGLLATSAVERAAREIGAAALGSSREELAGLPWRVATARGGVEVAGPSRDVHRSGGGSLVIVDLGGDDVYEGPAAVGLWPEQPVSVVLDLSGNDRYEAGEDQPSQGSGLGGVGILWDASGDDRYTARDRAQAYAQLGVGVLVDVAGNDVYRAGAGAQGAALFGAALLLDRQGDDRYEILHDGQGYGGPGGCGTLADLQGNDVYVAVRDPARAGRADPRADGKASTSNAQGVGIGRRGEGSDGHSWGGGIGALVDLFGNDAYAGGTWCQGAGYEFGTGVLVDASGNDTYEAVWYAQASAAHHGLGVLLDLSGDDRHTLSGTGGAGLGFGWDFSIGVFVDLAGRDEYRVRRLALGAAMQRSVALFLDAGGNDLYEAVLPEECFGFADDDPRWKERSPLAPALFEAPQVALFLDLDGADSYPAGRAQDGATWVCEAGRNGSPRNFGGGRDLAHGTLPEPLGWLVPGRAAAPRTP